MVHFLERSLVVLASNREERELFSESFWLTVLAAAFFYCEQLNELLRETDLVANLITVCQQLTDCPLPIHVALFRGFERLLLTGEKANRSPCPLTQHAISPPFSLIR